jgi:hypothetical protein
MRKGLVRRRRDPHRPDVGEDMAVAPGRSGGNRVGIKAGALAGKGGVGVAGKVCHVVAPELPPAAVQGEV